jgi:hypothetical protein
VSCKSRSRREILIEDKEGKDDVAVVGCCVGVSVGMVWGWTFKTVGVLRVMEDFQSCCLKDSITTNTSSDFNIVNEKDPFAPAEVCNVVLLVARAKVTATPEYGQTALFIRLGSKIALPDIVTGVTSVNTNEVLPLR